MSDFLTQSEIAQMLFPTAKVEKITLEYVSHGIESEDNPYIQLNPKAKSSSRYVSKYAEYFDNKNQEVLENSSGLKVTLRLYLEEEITNDNVVDEWLATLPNYLTYMLLEVRQFCNGELAGTQTKEFPDTSKSFNAEDRTNEARGRADRINDQGHIIYKIPLEFVFDNAPSSLLNTLSYKIFIKFDIPRLLSDYGLIISTERLEENRIIKTLSSVVTVIESGQVVDNRVQDFRVSYDVKKLRTDFSDIPNILVSPLAKYDQKINEVSQKKTGNVSDIKLSRDSDGNCRFLFAMDYYRVIQEQTEFGGFYEKEKILPKAQIKEIKILRKRVNIVNSANSCGTAYEDFEDFDSQGEIPVVVVSGGEVRMGNFQNVFSEKGSLGELIIDDTDVINGVRYFTGTDKDIAKINQGYYQYGVEIQILDKTKELFSRYRQELIDARKMLEKYYNECSIVGSNGFYGGESSRNEEQYVNDRPVINVAFPPSSVTGRGMPRINREIISPNAASPSDISPQRLVPDGNYDPITDRFTKKFIDAQLRKYSSFHRSPLTKAIVVYGTKLALLTSISQEDLSYLIKVFYRYIAPKTGNPTGVSLVIDAINSLINEMNNTLGEYIEDVGQNYNKASVTNSGVGGTLVGGRTLKLISITKWFHNDVFNASIDKQIGVSYLIKEDETVGAGKTARKKEDVGLLIIPGFEYESRIAAEMNKYLQSVNATPTGTEFSFLTPDDSSSNTGVATNQFREQKVVSNNKEGITTGRAIATKILFRGKR